MTEQTHPPTHTSIHPGTQIGMIGLNIADLVRSTQFYTNVLGFSVIQQAGDVVLLGPVDSRPLLALRERPGAQPKPRRNPTARCLSSEASHISLILRSFRLC